MTQSELKEAIIENFLPAFNNEKVEVNDSTVLKTVLSETDGFGASNSSRIFKNLVLWTIRVNNKTKKVKKFPPSWLDLSVSDFAQQILPE